MKKFNLSLGYGGIQGCVGYEYDTSRTLTNPIVDLIGTGNGWTKETHGRVEIRATGDKTVVRATGPGAWKIVGDESITG